MAFDTTTKYEHAMKGANSDITSLNGLTTAITLPQGGTGNLLGNGTSGQRITSDGDGTTSWANGYTSVWPSGNGDVGQVATSDGDGTASWGNGLALLSALTDVTGTDDLSWSLGDRLVITDNNDSDNAKLIAMPAEIGAAASDETSAQTTALQGKVLTFMVPRKMVVTNTKMSLTEVDSAGDIEWDVRYHATDPTSAATIYSDSNGITVDQDDYRAERSTFTDGGGGSQATYIIAESGFITVWLTTGSTEVGTYKAKGAKLWLLGYWF